MSDPTAIIPTMEQGKLSDELYCYECLSPIDDFTKYVIITPEIMQNEGDVLCENCYDPTTLQNILQEEWVVNYKNSNSQQSE